MTDNLNGNDLNANSNLESDGLEANSSAAVNSTEPNLPETPSEMTNDDSNANAWQLEALSEALGDLTLTVKDSLSVGRGSDNDVVLGSKEVSRNHAVLSVLKDELYVKDLDSSNGTFVNKERIEGNKSTLLQAEDTLSFASFDFKVTPAVQISEVPVTQIEESTDTMTNTDNTDAVNSELTNDVNPATLETEALVGTVTEQLEPSIDSPVEPRVAEETVLESSALANVEEEALADNSFEEDSFVEHKLSEDSSLLKDSSLNDELLVDNTATKDETISAEKTQEPIVKETIIAEVLAASAGMQADSVAPKETDLITPSNPTVETIKTEANEQESVMSNDTPKQPLAAEPVTDAHLTHEKGGHQESVVTPEHDKTTKTALQEEADPDVLRAKQAATAQFSGTANLGQNRDLGTEGNNAMDQAIDNPANAGHVDKKPSGSWFIWVFIAIIIIGLALWLFNMGGA